MDPVRLLVKSLSINQEDILQLEHAPPGNLNETWRCVLKGWPAAVYLKIQSGKHPSTTVAEEAEVLEVLKDWSPLVPKLIAHGLDEHSGKPYLISQEVRGVPFHRMCIQDKLNTPEHLLKQVANWLCDLQTNNKLRLILEGRISGSIGAYQPQFDPIADALELCSEIIMSQSELHQVFKALLVRNTKGKWSNMSSDIVHGSLTTFNLLADASVSEAYSLSGVLDFEATRIGNIMFDVANLAFYFLMSAYPSSAQAWFCVCSRTFSEVRIVTQAIPFLIYFYLRRSRARLTDATIMLPSVNEVISFLAEFG